MPAVLVPYFQSDINPKDSNILPSYFRGDLSARARLLKQRWLASNDNNDNSDAEANLANRTDGIVCNKLTGKVFENVEFGM